MHQFVGGDLRVTAARDAGRYFVGNELFEPSVTTACDVELHLRCFATGPHVAAACNAHFQRLCFQAVQLHITRASDRDLQGRCFQVLHFDIT